jgi:type IV secretory pathway VirB4 component
MAVNSRAAQPSQDFVPIEQVRDGIVVLKDGSVRAILMASSINLVLKSAEEQVAILSQFQQFLNSLDFSVQISIQSRALDIRPYLALLESRHEEQPTELMKIQVREYIEFVKSFVENSSIMTKSFYIIIPYNPAAINTAGKKMGGLTGLLGTPSKGQQTITPQQLAEYRSQLEQRISVVVQGLGRVGVRSAQLGTEEVIELFYKLFNMGEQNRALPVGDLSALGQQQS